MRHSLALALVVVLVGTSTATAQRLSPSGGDPAGYLADPDAFILELRRAANAVAGPQVRRAVNDLYGSSPSAVDYDDDTTAELVDEAANGREGGVFNIFRRERREPVLGNAILGILDVSRAITSATTPAVSSAVETAQQANPKP